MHQAFRLLAAALVVAAALLLVVHAAPQQSIQPPPPSPKCQAFLDSIRKDSKCFGPVTAVVDDLDKVDMETGAKTFPIYYRRFLDAYCKPECNKPHEDLINAAIANCEAISQGWSNVEFSSSAGKDANKARLDWVKSYQLGVRDLMCMRDPTDSSKMCSPDLLDTARQYQIFNDTMFPFPGEAMTVMYGFAASHMVFAWKASLMQPHQDNLTVVPPEALCTPCRAAGLTQAALHWIQEFAPYTNTSQGWPNAAEQKKSWEQQAGKMNKYCEAHNIKNPSKAAVFQADAKVAVGLPANDSSAAEAPSKSAGGDSGNKKPDGSSGAPVMTQVGMVMFASVMLAVSAAIL